MLESLAEAWPWLSAFPDTWVGSSRNKEDLLREIIFEAYKIQRHAVLTLARILISLPKGWRAKKASRTAVLSLRILLDPLGFLGRSKRNSLKENKQSCQDFQAVIIELLGKIRCEPTLARAL